MFKKILSLIVVSLFCSTANASEIVISLRNKTLTFYSDDGYVYEYPVAVPKKSAQWTGTEVIVDKKEWPVWTPTAETKRAKPYLPDQVAGGPNNPLGARALYLGNTLYRIHGTNDPNSIGHSASRGCFRMINEHVIELYDMVDIGTVVHVQ